MPTDRYELAQSIHAANYYEGSHLKLFKFTVGKDSGVAYLTVTAMSERAFVCGC